MVNLNCEHYGVTGDAVTCDDCLAIRAEDAEPAFDPYARQRTWTAKVEVRIDRGGAILDAKPSEYDLMRDQIQSAVNEAAVMLTGNAQVTVILYKTTKARGTERDRSFVVFRDRRGQVRYQ